MNQVKYLIRINGVDDSEHETLKKAREYEKSLINVYEVQKIKAEIEVFSVKLKKLTFESTKASVVGDVETVFETEESETEFF